jgi:endonuclease/exonuclease/phosphatase family metal-dependent hydrolase
VSAEGVRIVSYNLHRCIGLDARKDVGRIAAVLQETNADVIALQEAEAVHRDGRLACQIEDLAQRLGMQAIHGPTIVGHQGRYGNGLLTRLPAGAPDRLDLSHRRREPRGALIVDLDVPGSGRLRVACTHLGLRAAERTAQVGALLERLDGAAPLVLIGDLNEWFPGSRLLARLARRFGAGPRPATYPSFRPLLALDRVFVTPSAALRSAHAHRSRLSRIASDHLPLVGVIDLALSGPAGAPSS